MQYRVSFPAPEHHYAQVEVTWPAVTVATLEAHTDGYQLAFAVGAVLCLLGAIAAVTLMGRRAEAPAPAFAEERAA